MPGKYPAIDSSFSGPIVVDPITRLEGHLRIEVEVTNGRVSNAWSVGTLFRGLEIILKGREPEDAQHLTQRACGVCTFTHGLASTRALDDAVGVTIPPLAHMMRNLVLAAQYLHDHVVHFYHLHALDFVDVSNCVNADPQKAAKLATSISSRRTSTEDMRAVQDRIKKYIASGQLGHLTNAYFLGKHPAYLLSPELDLIATAHYLEGLRLQIKAARAMAIFGGKNPHPQFLIAGGVSNYEALKPENIQMFLELERETIAFVNEVYLPDLSVLADAYREVATYGATRNFMTFGEFSREPDKPETAFFKPGIIRNQDLSKIEPFDPDKIAEHVRHSWYKGAEARKPFEGETEPAFTDLHGDERYSWSKAPRYDDEPMETGPLAQILVAYADGNETVVSSVNKLLATLDVGPKAMFSTFGRMAARGIESVVIANEIERWTAEFQDQIRRERKPRIAVEWTMPNDAQGVGFVNAPRGGLSHWIRIEDKKIANFQLVVPTTWNLGPRCANGKLSPCEEALIGTPIADPKRPVEILRTVHSFDPCLACAIHVIDPQSNEVRVFKVS